MRKRNRTVIKADRIEHVDVAKVHNPRYLVSRDGEEVGIFPGYNALMAINAARKIYGPGKYSSTKTGEAMYLGRGALETERREREERTARAAAKAAAKRDKIQLPKKSRTRRNAAGKADILQQGVKAGLLPAGLVTDLQRLEEGRFPADPARRAIDQATTAERRSNPQPWKIPRGYEAEYQTHSGKLNQLYGLALQFYSRQSPMKTPQFLADAHKLARLEIEELPYTFAKDYSGKPFDELLEKRIHEFKSDLLDKTKRRIKRNPPVREIFETFNGRPATRATSVEAPRRTPARVAQLGRLRLIRTADGRTWRFPGERAPFLAADSRGKLHVVGGQYRANPAGEECGEIEQIEYQTSKPHLGHDNETIYYHQLGEETGERPILEITPEGELQIIGGDYRIEADGIHN